MAKVDSLKEEIGWLKIVFGLLVAVDVSLIGWIAQNQTTASRFMVLSGLVAATAATFAVAWIHLLAYRRIRQLEDV